MNGVRRTMGALFLSVAVLGGTAAWATVKPHALFSDGVVLQQGMPVPVWGTASDGEKVTVTCQGQTVSTTAADGRWRVRLQPLRAGGPFTMTIAGENKVEVRDVLVGEVWVCSGQSNMQWPLSLTTDAPRTIARSADQMLHLFTVPHVASNAPLQDVKGAWRARGTGDSRRLLGRRLLLRPRPAPGAEGAGRPDPHLLGRHAGGGVDQPRGAGERLAAYAASWTGTAAIWKRIPQR